MGKFQEHFVSPFHDPFKTPELEQKKAFSVKLSGWFGTVPNGGIKIIMVY